MREQIDYQIGRQGHTCVDEVGWTPPLGEQ
jgi:hypothetical protein